MDDTRRAAGPFAPGDLVRVLPSERQPGYLATFVASRDSVVQVLQFELKRTRYADASRVVKPTAYQRQKYARWIAARDWRKVGKLAG